MKIEYYDESIPEPENIEELINRPSPFNFEGGGVRVIRMKNGGRIEFIKTPLRHRNIFKSANQTGKSKAVFESLIRMSMK